MSLMGFLARCLALHERRMVRSAVVSVAVLAQFPANWRRKGRESWSNWDSCGFAYGNGDLGNVFPISVDVNCFVFRRQIVERFCKDFGSSFLKYRCNRCFVVYVFVGFWFGLSALLLAVVLLCSFGLFIFFKDVLYSCCICCCFVVCCCELFVDSASLMRQ